MRSELRHQFLSASDGGQQYETRVKTACENRVFLVRATGQEADRRQRWRRPTCRRGVGGRVSSCRSGGTNRACGRSSRPPRSTRSARARAADAVPEARSCLPQPGRHRRLSEPRLHEPAAYVAAPSPLTLLEAPAPGLRPPSPRGSGSELPHATARWLATAVPNSTASAPEFSDQRRGRDSNPRSSF